MNEQMTTQSTESVEHSRYLSFSLGEEEYAIPLLSVREVIGIPDITPIPFTPSYFKGIMNLRGQVISVIDLRSKFAIKPRESSETAVIICDLAPLCLGVIVDSVNSVLTPDASDISDKPVIESSRGSEYITSVFRKDKKLVLLLDIAKTLNADDHKAMSKAAPLKAA